MIRILHVVTKMDMAGLETMIMNYYRHIDRTEIQFDFIVHREERGAYDNEIESLGGTIYRLPSMHPRNLCLYCKELKKFFCNHKEYKIIHSHLNEMSTIVLRYARLAGIPVRIAHSHTTAMERDIKIPIRYISKILLKKECNYRMACSQSAGNWLFGHNSRFTIIKNAIDVDKFIYDKDVEKRIRVEFGLEDKFVIGHVGRFDANKNQMFLLDIIENLVKIRADCLLILIGEGSNKDIIIKNIQRRKLDGVVRVFGSRNDINNLMQCFNIFVFPSHYEGLGMALIEAQASGLPCVVSNSVAKDANITDLVHFLSLDDKISHWVDTILGLDKAGVNYSIEDQKRINDYDIKGNSKMLIEKYKTFMLASTAEK